MKPEEAIEIAIYCLCVSAGYEVCEECKIYGDDDLACREVARYAIEALKEVQRYQLIKDVTIGEIAEALKAFSEIGTVEECWEAKRFKEYFDELYGTGLEVANWHENGDTEPFDNFYDAAIDWSE